MEEKQNEGKPAFMLGSVHIVESNFTVAIEAAG
jgi:hypothetical protein